MSQLRLTTPSKFLISSPKDQLHACSACLNGQIDVKSRTCPQAYIYGIPSSQVNTNDQIIPVVFGSLLIKTRHHAHIIQSDLLDTNIPSNKPMEPHQVCQLYMYAWYQLEELSFFFFQKNPKYSCTMLKMARSHWSIPNTSLSYLYLDIPTYQGHPSAQKHYPFVAL